MIHKFDHYKGLFFIVTRYLHTSASSVQHAFFSCVTRRHERERERERKENKTDADPRAIQQINFTANLDRAGTTMLFITEEAKEIVLDFSQGTVKFCDNDVL